MVSTYSTNIRLDLQGTGDNNGTWGTVANTDFSLIDAAIAGYTTVSVSGGDTALTVNNGSSDQARNAIIEVIGSPASNANIVLPANSKAYIVRCSLSNTKTVTFKTSSGSGFVLTNGVDQTVITDGTSVTGIQTIANTGVTSGTIGVPNLSVNSYGQVVSATEAIVSAGILVRTSTTATYAARSVTGLIGVSVTNPDGAAGDIVVGLCATGVASGTIGNPLSFDVNSTGQILAVVSAASPRTYELAFSATNAVTTCTVAIPYDNTIPQITEGNQIFSVTVTPQSASSFIRVRATLNISCDDNSTMALFKDSGVNAVAVACGPSPGTSQLCPVTLVYREPSSNTTSRVYSIRVGSQTNPVVVNGLTIGNKMGGKLTSTILIEEIM